MKEIDKYYQGYTESDDTLAFKKHGLLNEYGLNLDRSKKYYNESEIIKRKCNIKKSSGK